MILVLAVFLGLFAGVLRAWLTKRTYQPVGLKHLWIVFVAFIPQFLSFYIPATRVLIPDAAASAGLIFSQAFLFVFAFSNRNQPGFWVLTAGLLLNFLVITLNGGWMPLQPETAQKLIPPGVEVALEIGQRVGYGKDILLPTEMTRLWFLGDVFTLPGWLNYRLAFSIGDILISFGAFRFFWSLGAPQYPHKTARVIHPPSEEKGCYRT